MPASPATAELLARALLARGIERGRDSQWADAVDSFVRAAAAGADVAQHAGVLVETVRRRVAELRDKDEDAARAVVAVMESVHPLVPRDPAFDADFAASYAELGKEVNNSDDYEQAVVLLRKSLRLVPDDPNTRRFARIGMANLAYQLLSEGPPSVMGRAFGLFDESLTHTDTDQLEQERAQVADLMFGQARKRAEEGDRATALVILRAARRHVDDDITRRSIAALESGGQLP